MSSAADPTGPGDPAGDTSGAVNPVAVAVAGAAADGPLHGRPAFVDQLCRSLLGLDGAAGAGSLVLRDRDFQHWPLDDAAVLDALARWLRPPGRSLTLIGTDFGAAAGHHPRFARWRRDWVHRMAAWTPPEPGQSDQRALLLAPRHAVQLLDPLHWRGLVVVEPAQLRALREQCDAQMQQCEPAWPATTLGL